MSAEQLISHFKECRERFAEMLNDRAYLPLHCAILRAEGQVEKEFAGYDFARILGQFPHWSSNFCFNPTDGTFALAFYLDSGKETPERIKKAVDAVDSVANEAMRLLFRLPPEVQERLGLDKSESWWCAVFHLAWHFRDRPFLKASRRRLLTKDGRSFEACLETRVQRYGTNNRRDLMPGLIYSCLEHDIRKSSEVAIDLIISVLGSCPKKRAPVPTFPDQYLLLPIIHKRQSGAELSEEEKQELSVLLAELDKFEANPDNALVRSLSDEQRAEFRNVRTEFDNVAPHLAEENKRDHPSSNRHCKIDCKIMKFADSFTSPPATEWAQFTIGAGGAGGHEELILLSQHDADQEWLQIWGPFTTSFVDIAKRAGEALPVDVPDCPILWSWEHEELQRPVMDRGPLARWVGFVFWVLKERSQKSIEFTWRTDFGPLNNGLATLKPNLFAASVLAIDLAGLAAREEQQVPDEKQSGGARKRLHKSDLEIDAKEPLTGAERDSAFKALEPAEQKAYLAFQYAESRMGRGLQDRDAHELLEEEGIPSDGGNTGDLIDYEPPNFDTWSRQLRTARRALGEQKRRRGRGRTTRSIVKVDQIENQTADE